MHNTLSRLREKRAAEGERGFTLIELLVVVVILGVLIAIAIPLYLNYRKGANDAAAESDLRGAVNALEQCQTDAGHYPKNDFDFGSDDQGSQQGVPDCGSNGPQINLSTATRFQYRVGNNPVQGGSYTIIDRNANGSGKSYCYNSAHGGQVIAMQNPVADPRQAGGNAC